MPVRMEDVSVTEDDVTAAMRSDNLKRIDRFINTASPDEVLHIKKSLAYRSMSLGLSMSSPKPKPKTVDRALARFAVELVPILLTVFVAIPLVLMGIFKVMGNEYFLPITSGCPESCGADALLLWSVVSGVGFMLIILAYYSLRKLMIRARK